MQATYCKVCVLGNEQKASDIKLMQVEYDAKTYGEPKAGQFFMLRAWAKDEAPLLSRPISVHDYDAKTGVLTFLYQVKGIGTEKLAALQTNDTLTLVGPVGKGFPVQNLQGKVALIGGGIGTAPLLLLAKKLQENAVHVDFYGGWRSEVYCLDSFEAVCQKTAVATDLGTQGTKGFVTDIVPYAEYDAVCVCGPEIVMEKVAHRCHAVNVTCYVSKEAKMACGVGACLGCTCISKKGAKSVCKDGPVFEASEVYEL